MAAQLTAVHRTANSSSIGSLNSYLQGYSRQVRRYARYTYDLSYAGLQIIDTIGYYRAVEEPLFNSIR